MRSLALFLLRAYRLLFSSFTQGHCRFYPSCSQYAIDALNHYSLFKALLKIILRLLKCGPWHPGGIDEVPPK